MSFRDEIEAEFAKASQARSRANEGQARVCARRAAGIAAREYLARHGQPIRTSSAYDVLQVIANAQTVSDDLRAIARRLTLRVNEEFKLPPGIDLVAEARSFCRGLLSD